VPLAEVNIDPAIKAAVLGKPVSELSPWLNMTDFGNEVAFWIAAGYDYVPIPVGVGPFLEQLYQARAAGRLTTPKQGGKRVWAEEKAGIITSWDEFEAFEWPSLVDKQLLMLEEVGRCLPSGAKAIGVLFTAIFTTVWRLMGFEAFCYSLVDNPSLVDAIFEKVGAIQFDMVNAVAGSPAIGAIWITDDIAYTEGLMVAPSILRRCLFPWFEMIGRVAEDAGLPLIYHSDGRLYPVLDDLIACGINAIHPIEPKGMDIEYLKHTVGDRLCLIGNIDLSYTLTRGTPQEVEGEVRLRLRTIAPGGGYCLGSSNSITDYVLLENFNAMRETVFKHGRYPIAL
jgi:uroporphyrinogen decarboxylase